MTERESRIDPAYRSTCEWIQNPDVSPLPEFLKSKDPVLVSNSHNVILAKFLSADLEFIVGERQSSLWQIHHHEIHLE